MTTTNLEIYQLAIRSSDEPDRAERERKFAESYQRTLGTSGSGMAEALARSEALAVLLRLDVEAAAYLRPHLR